ncbi:MAG: hypothetical protein R3282_01530, partial [Rhodothermales bacterium]|nr:hypothetical protein [Rhodothermales bacterium]
MNRSKLLAALAALTLVLAACTTDAGTNGGNGDSAGGTLQAVLDRGELNCGVNESLPGFGVVDDQGNFSGVDIEFCRVVAA